MGRPATPSVITVDEYFALPEDNSHRHELLEGVYVVSPPPTFRHQKAVMALYHRLLEAISDRSDLVLMPVPGAVVLEPRSVVQPDGERCLGRCLLSKYYPPAAPSGILDRGLGRPVGRALAAGRRAPGNPQQGLTAFLAEVPTLSPAVP